MGQKDEQSDNKRRIKRVLIQPELLAGFLVTGAKVPMPDGYAEITDGILADANTVGAAHDPRSNEFVLFIEHDSFDEVEQGMLPEAMYLTATRHYEVQDDQGAL